MQQNYTEHISTYIHACIFPRIGLETVNTGPFHIIKVFLSISNRLEPDRNMNYFVMERYLMYIVFPSN